MGSVVCRGGAKTSPLKVRGTAGPSATLRSGRDDKERACRRCRFAMGMAVLCCLCPCGYVTSVHEVWVALIPGLKSETWGTLRVFPLIVVGVDSGTSDFVKSDGYPGRKACKSICQQTWPRFLRLPSGQAVRRDDTERATCARERGFSKLIWTSLEFRRPSGTCLSAAPLDRQVEIERFSFGEST